jgi:WD40 repeat protein
VGVFETAPSEGLPEYSVTRLAWSSDGAALLSKSRGCGDTPAAVSLHEVTFQANTGSRSRAFALPTLDSALSSDGGKLLFATDRGEMFLWDLSSDSLSEPVKANGAPIVASAMSRDQRVIVGGTEKGEVLMYDSERDSLVVLAGSSAVPVARIQFSSDDRRMLDAHSDGSIVIWDVSTKTRLQQRHMENTRGAAAATFVDGGKAVMSCVNAAEMEIWDAATGQVHWSGARGKCGDQGVTNVAVSRDGTLASWGCHNSKDVVLWDLQRGNERRVIKNKSYVLFASLNPDGTRVAVGGQERLIRLYDTLTGKEMAQIDAAPRIDEEMRL